MGISAVLWHYEKLKLFRLKWLDTASSAGYGGLSEGTNALICHYFFRDYKGQSSIDRYVEKREQIILAHKRAGSKRTEEADTCPHHAQMDQHQAFKTAV